MIGDPSGKSEERNLLSVDVLQNNIDAMQSQLTRFLDFDCAANSALLVNNHDWMSQFTYLDFLRDVGKHSPVNVMLSKDSVLNTPMSSATEAIKRSQALTGITACAMAVSAPPM